MVAGSETVAEILRPLAERDDARFEALRPYLLTYEDVQDGIASVQTDLGAIVRAAAACGYRLEPVWLYADMWACYVRRLDEAEPVVLDASSGASPEEAAARALVAAVEAMEG